MFSTIRVFEAIIEMAVYRLFFYRTVVWAENVSVICDNHGIFGLLLFAC